MRPSAYHYQPLKDRNCVLKGENHRLSATTSMLRRGHDLPAVALGWQGGEPQASGSPVCLGGPASEEARAQKDSADRASPVGAPDIGQPGYSPLTLCLTARPQCPASRLDRIDDATQEALAIVPGLR